MSLQYERPKGALAVELREVARDADALINTLTTGLNASLPTDFPKHQLIEIALSLAKLPSGTAEGSGAALEYGRNRLPAIRREHFLSEEGQTFDADSATVMRGAMIDQRLGALITSVLTAHYEYRRLLGEQIGEEKPEAGVSVAGTTSASVIAKSSQLDSKFSEARAAIDQAANPHSPLADNFKRQINDSQGLTRLLRAELLMPKVIASWYRRIVSALAKYPSLLRNTAINLKVGADITEIGLSRWHDFKHKQLKFYTNEFRKTCDAAIKIADILDAKRQATRGTERIQTRTKTKTKSSVVDSGASNSETPKKTFEMPHSGSAIRPHVPYLRRYSGALTGSKKYADELIGFALKAYLSGAYELPASLPPKVMLFRLFHCVWSNERSSKKRQKNATPMTAGDRLFLLPKFLRAVLLLNAEGFSLAEAGRIVDKSAEQIERAIFDAQEAIEQQLETNILIIEDEKIIGGDLAIIAEELGHKVVGIASTKSEAVAIAHANSIGLILADINLHQDESGIDAVVEILRSVDIPTIFVSAYPERLLTSARPEPTYLITKPFLPETVQATIGQALFFHLSR